MPNRETESRLLGHKTTNICIHIINHTINQSYTQSITHSINQQKSGLHFRVSKLVHTKYILIHVLNVHNLFKVRIRSPRDHSRLTDIANTSSFIVTGLILVIKKVAEVFFYSGRSAFKTMSYPKLGHCTLFKRVTIVFALMIKTIAMLLIILYRLSIICKQQRLWVKSKLIYFINHYRESLRAY